MGKCLYQSLSISAECQYSEHLTLQQHPVTVRSIALLGLICRQCAGDGRPATREKIPCVVSPKAGETRTGYPFANGAPRCEQCGRGTRARGRGAMVEALVQ
jgi:hypothetical protein